MRSGQSGKILCVYRVPEYMPAPAKSIQQLQREEQKRLEKGQQPSLFGESTEG